MVPTGNTWTAVVLGINFKLASLANVSSESRVAACRWCDHSLPALQCSLYLQQIKTPPALFQPSSSKCELHSPAPGKPKRLVRFRCFLLLLCSGSSSLKTKRHHRAFYEREGGISQRVYRKGGALTIPPLSYRCSSGVTTARSNPAVSNLNKDRLQPPQCCWSWSYIISH